MKQNRIEKTSVTLTAMAAIAAVLIALGMYAFLGTFSRYTSDDYCLSAFYVRDTDFLTNMAARYQVSSSRYTNILFIGFADKVFGWYNPAVLPPLMLTLFVAGLYLFLDQIQKLARLSWSRWFSFYLAALIVYFSLVQAPDLYETLYWRAGMTSHFAPIAFLPFLGAFVIKQIRLASERIPPGWVYAVCFVMMFMIGGLSEPPTTLMVTTLGLAIFAVWWWVPKSPVRRSILMILFSTLAGAFIALMVLALAPANAQRLGNTESNLFVLAWSTFSKTLEFMADTVRTLPLPVFFSLVIPALLFHMTSSNEESPSKSSFQNLAVFIPVVLLISYILIAASFAPSVYGQGFPAARARFAGVVLFSATCMMIGAFTGKVTADSKMILLRSSWFRISIMIMFILLSLYPLRTAWRLASEVPAYQQRAAAWDARDLQIRTLKAEGVRDLTVPFLSDDAVQDLGDRREFRLNRCAARLYGVNSILAKTWNEK